ncbi:MAG: transposase [bacterium]
MERPAGPAATLHCQGVVAYLARCVRGGPIRDRRLVSTSPTTTTFSYTNHRYGRMKRIGLPSEEFLRRLFWHVPEPRSHGVRLYGLCGRRHQATCEACRAILPAPASEAPRRRAEDPERPAAQGRRCSICGEPLASIADVMPERPDSHPILLPQRLKSP